MTPQQQLQFREQGYLLLKGALGGKRLQPLREQVLDELKRLRIWAAGKTLSPSIQKMPAFQQIGKISQLLRLDDLAARLASPELDAAITGLAGRKLRAAQSQLLISLPNQGQWTLQGLNWHNDIAPPPDGRIPGIQVFALIDEVQPKGGATLALAGSHLLYRDEKMNAEVRSLLREGGEAERALRDRGLPVIEMCGQAGDVYLMDMRLLHTPSLNAARKPRMMATVRHLPAAAVAQ